MIFQHIGVFMAFRTGLEPVPAADYGVLMPARVHFDDLDAYGMLGNNRYPVLVERAWNTYWEESAEAESGVGDALSLVKQASITYDRPVVGTGPYAIQIWIERVGRTSATWGYRFCSTDGQTIYAHGTRTNVRVDATGTPVPWSEKTRALAEQITRSHK